MTEERTLDEIKTLLERSTWTTRSTTLPTSPAPLHAATGSDHDQGTREDHAASTPSTSSGKRFPYQEDMSLVEDVDLMAATPGEDINWLEDVDLLGEDGVPAVFDRYSNSFLKIYFPIPEGRENEIARKVLIKHLQSGNSYGIQLKEKHASSPSPSSAPGWRARAPSATTGSRRCSRAGSRRVH